MVKERLRATSERCPVLGGRSLLVLPVATLDLGAAIAAGADAVAIELDAAIGLAPGVRTERLCRHAQAIRAAPRPTAFVVGIGGLATDGVEADLDAAMAARPDAILLLNDGTGEAVAHLAAKMAVLEACHDIAASQTRIMAIANATAAAVLTMARFAGSSARLAGLAWNEAALATDLSLCIQAEVFEAPSPILLARALTVLGARAAGVPALDTASERSGDAFSAECANARRDGFSGKITRHPAQVAIINRAFTRPDAGPESR